MKKPTMFIQNRSDKDKMARSLNCRILEEEGLYYPCTVTEKLICAYVFAYANCWFSDAAAQI